MNVYIWDRLECVSANYHSGGGLLIVAESLEAARQIIAEKLDDPGPRYPVNCDGKTVDPTVVLPTSDNASPMMMVFPDAGCC